LIERAIRDYATKTTVGDGEFEPAKNWLDYWHPEEGVRTINMLFDHRLQTDFEEDELRDFIEQHKEFFYNESRNGTPIPITGTVQVLWPDISKYVEHWRETKTQSRWATGHKMLAAIKAADMKGPAWPRTSPPRKETKSDMDDDIPF
jgi:hypothetical protein